MNSTDRFQAWTDGGWRQKTGIGGWAFVMKPSGDGFAQDEKSATVMPDAAPTNQRMELLAVIKVLEALPDRAEVTVYTDSQYVANTVNEGWNIKANTDLWQKFADASMNHEVKVEWISRNSVPEHERADELAKAATKPGGEE
jgi:ribonuclease HI